MEEITFQRCGNALAVALPKAMTDRLNLAPGDPGYAVETESGILLTPRDSDVARVMEAGTRISEQYENALRGFG